MIITNLRTFEEALIKYKELLGKNPENEFYKNLVTNTEEMIKDIKEHKIFGLKIKQQNDEQNNEEF